MTLTDIVTHMPWYQRLIILRIRKNFSQRKLAAEIGVHPDTYRRWESGRHYPGRLARKLLAQYHQISEIEIFGGQTNAR